MLLYCVYRFIKCLSRVISVSEASNDPGPWLHCTFELDLVYLICLIIVRNECII